MSDPRYRVTAELVAEHETILRALEVLERLVDLVEEDPREGASYIEEVGAMLTFVRDYADRLHHGVIGQGPVEKFEVHDARFFFGSLTHLEAMPFSI